MKSTVMQNVCQLITCSYFILVSFKKSAIKVPKSKNQKKSIESYSLYIFEFYSKISITKYSCYQNLELLIGQKL